MKVSYSPQLELQRILLPLADFFTLAIWCPKLRLYNFPIILSPPMSPMHHVQDSRRFDSYTNLENGNNTRLSAHRCPRHMLHYVLGYSDPQPQISKEPLSATVRRKAFQRRVLLSVAFISASVILAVTYVLSNPLSPLRDRFLRLIPVRIWYALLLALISRLSPPPTPLNGLQQILVDWIEPGSGDSNRVAWREGFSRDVVPIACHSHNDYWRRVPLYDALAAGCTGVEADVWLHEGDLYVGHTMAALTPNRTLKNLYIDPLVSILLHQNAHGQLGNAVSPRGVFDSSANASLVLFLDFKTDGSSLWPVVLEQLEPLRSNGWLTNFNGKTVTQGPITVVASGNAPFDLLTANATYRDVFYDAPLDELNDAYTMQNSHYASVSFQKAVGRVWFNHLSSKQVGIIRSQVNLASSKGLLARYWDTPSWPISVRTEVWRILEENGVGMLNVDDLAVASRWNWRWCSVLGLTLC